MSKEKPTEKDIVLEFDDGVAKSYLQKEYNRRHSRQVFWTMGNGTTINIKEMSDEHLLNAIKFIEKVENEKDDYYEALGSYPDF